MDFDSNFLIDTYNHDHNGGVTFKDDKGYTEDGVLIYKLYVSNLKPHIKDHHLLAYFCQFGPLDVEIIRSKGRMHKFFQYAFVTFEEAESAAKALQLHVHRLRNKNITVKAADSWKQPHCEEFLRGKTETYKGFIDPNESPICRLNDDCLIHINSFLKLSDQFKLSKIGPRFEAIFETVFKTKYKIINIDDSIPLPTLMEWKLILEEYGQYVESVHQSFTFSSQTRFVEFVPNYCTNLNSINITSLGGPLPTIFYKKMFSNLKVINSIVLKDCRVDDLTVLYLSRIKTLKALDISENFDVTGKHLDKFTQLEELNLEGCANIQPSFFGKMCEKLRQLRTLNINRCIRLNNSAINQLSKYCKEIRCLTVTTECEAELHPIANLPELEKLSITSSTRPSKDRLFQDIANKLKNQLRSLTVNSYNILGQTKKEAICDMTNLDELKFVRMLCVDDEFLKMLSTLPNLKTFTIIWCTSISQQGMLDFIRDTKQLEKLTIAMNLQFDTQFILNTIDLLKKKPAMAKPFCLVVSDAMVDEELLNHPSVVENKSIIEISSNLGTFMLEDILSDSIFDDDDDYDFDDDDDYYDHDDYDYYDIEDIYPNDDLLQLDFDDIEQFF